MFRLFFLFVGFVLFPQFCQAQSWTISPDKDYHKGVVVVQGDGLQGSGTVVKFVEDAGENYIGLILTASHCVKGKSTLFDVFFSGGKKYRGGTVVYNSRYTTNTYNDIALIEALIPDEIPVVDISSEPVKCGEQVEMCGYATGSLRHWNAKYAGSSIPQDGHVVFSWAIQGDSGGPILYNGKIIGVICFGTAVDRFNDRYIIGPIHGTNIDRVRGYMDNYRRDKT
jgi:hypothetical protein